MKKQVSVSSETLRGPSFSMFLGIAEVTFRLEDTKLTFICRDTRVARILADLLNYGVHEVKLEDED